MKARPRRYNASHLDRWRSVELPLRAVALLIILGASASGACQNDREGLLIEGTVDLLDGETRRGGFTYDEATPLDDDRAALTDTAAGHCVLTYVVGAPWDQTHVDLALRFPSSMPELGDLRSLRVTNEAGTLQVHAEVGILDYSASLDASCAIVSYFNIWTDARISIDLDCPLTASDGTTLHASGNFELFHCEVIQLEPEEE